MSGRWRPTGKKVYHVTPEGEAIPGTHRDSWRRFSTESARRYATLPAEDMGELQGGVRTPRRCHLQAGMAPGTGGSRTQARRGDPP